METRIPQDQVDEIVKRVAQTHVQHGCRFSEDEARSMHLFAQMMQNGGAERMAAVLEFGQIIISARKAGIVALVTVIVGGVLSVMWLGLQHLLSGGSK